MFKKIRDYINLLFGRTESILDDVRDLEDKVKKLTDNEEILIQSFKKKLLDEYDGVLSTEFDDIIYIELGSLNITVVITSRLSVEYKGIYGFNTKTTFFDNFYLYNFSLFQESMNKTLLDYKKHLDNIVKEYSP